MNNKEIIQKFYTAFSENNSKEMINCYHDQIVFKDPVFGKLKGEKAKKMWAMLLSNKQASSKIKFSKITATKNSGFAKWEATYLYGSKKKPVINKVSAHFIFEDNKIIAHTDNFNLWNWSKQALGFSGAILGWSEFLKRKIQKQANQKLNNHIDNQYS